VKSSAAFESASTDLKVVVVQFLSEYLAAHHENLAGDAPPVRYNLVTDMWSQHIRNVSDKEYLCEVARRFRGLRPPRPRLRSPQRTHAKPPIGSGIFSPRPLRFELTSIFLWPHMDIWLYKIASNATH
jgi:hypothetical protein